MTHATPPYRTVKPGAVQPTTEPDLPPREYGIQWGKTAVIQRVGGSGTWDPVCIRKWIDGRWVTVEEAPKP